jgi:hypothetical protein
MMHQRHIELLKSETAITDEDLQSATATLQRLDRFLNRVPDVDASTTRQSGQAREHCTLSGSKVPLSRCDLS